MPLILIEQDRQSTYAVTFGCVLATIVPVKKAISITYSESVRLYP